MVPGAPAPAPQEGQGALVRKLQHRDTGSNNKGSTWMPVGLTREGRRGCTGERVWKRLSLDRLVPLRCRTP